LTRFYSYFKKENIGEKIMDLELKNELKLYKMTIQNRLKTVDQYLTKNLQ